MASTPAAAVAAAAAAAAANTNDDPAPTAAEVVVGLCGGDGGQEDTCNKIAKAFHKVAELYARDALCLKSFIMWWNTKNDRRAKNRLEQALKGDPIEQVDPEARTFKSWFSIMDDRKDLMLYESAGENYELEVAAIASKFAYENAARAKDLVTTKLQGRDFEFFDCPNVVLGEVRTTQALGFVREERGRNVVYVAFRGSSELNDWRANLDCGLIEVREDWGKVHVGFMKALGLIGNTGSFEDDFPDELPRDYPRKLPAYYDLRRWLNWEVEQLWKEEANGACPDIAVRVVGHSLGGALAVLFVAMLVYHKATDKLRVNSMEVITLGQPRVGDSTFARFMTRNVFTSSNRAFTYKRMVYSYDPVPRVPADDDPTRRSYSIYRHFGTCLYYKNWFTKQRSTDDRLVDYPSVYLSDVDGYSKDAYNANERDIERASANRGKLKEPDTVVMGRERNLFLTQFHTVGEYLNAARHGTQGGSRSSSLVRRLLRSLLHYPTSFWNTSTRRRRGIIATTDHEDDVSSSYV